MITQEQVQAVLNKDYWRYKIHLIDDPIDDGRFRLYRNHVSVFGLGKNLAPELLPMVIKKNLLTCMVGARDRLISETFAILSIGTPFDVWDYLRLTKKMMNEEDVKTPDRTGDVY